MTREELFRKAISENRGRIFRICNYYFEDASDRDDAFQEAMIRIWQSLPKFRGDALMSTWIYRISVNTCLAFIRSEKRRKDPMAGDPALHAEGTFVDQGQETDDLQGKKLEFFRKFMSGLSAIDRSLVTLYLEEVGTREISAVTGLSEANVRVRIHRLKEQVKKDWEEMRYGTR
jgi:RNA polymerase sigma-70 factor (ECF subfamily)